jgi:hypothetical protein
MNSDSSQYRKLPAGNGKAQSAGIPKRTCLTRGLSLGAGKAGALTTPGLKRPGKTGRLLELHESWSGGFHSPSGMQPQSTELSKREDPLLLWSSACISSWPNPAEVRGQRNQDVVYGDSLIPCAKSRTENEFGRGAYGRE